MRTTMIRLAAASGLALAVHFAMDGENKVSAAENLNAVEMTIDVVGDNESSYTIVGVGHNYFGQTLTQTFIEQNNLCPSTGQTCAREVGNETNVIQWSGGSSKF